MAIESSKDMADKSKASRISPDVPRAPATGVGALFYAGGPPSRVVRVVADGAGRSLTGKERSWL